jgi:hypothetical protein
MSCQFNWLERQTGACPLHEDHETPELAVLERSTLVSRRAQQCHFSQYRHYPLYSVGDRARGAWLMIRSSAEPCAPC